MTNGTSSITFVPRTVREVAARVKTFTDGYFALETHGSDLGSGTRYFDAHTQTVWFGPTGARQACAYYIGGALGTAEVTGKMIPWADAEYFRSVQNAYLNGSERHQEDMRAWEEKGRERAKLHAEATS